VAAATVAGVPDSDGVGLLVYATTLGGYLITGSFTSGCRRRRWGVSLDRRPPEPDGRAPET
jgi:hypothetical protein